MTQEHSPTPWVKGSAGQIASEGLVIAITVDKPFEVCLANAALIVKAVNRDQAFDDLVKALEQALNFIENTESELGITLQSGDAARLALIKAKAVSA